MKKVIRYDVGEIYAWEDKDGFLEGSAVVTRTGVFKYLNADGSTRGELRHPSDVFKADSTDSLKMIPMTLDHPSSLVTPENSKQLSVGFVGENVKIDSNTVSVSFKITDKRAIKAVQDGKNQLSLGYEVEEILESGEWEGERYDLKQTQIEYNHLAIVDNARAGEIAKIKLDSAINLTLDNINSNREYSNMATIKVDSIDYENQAPEVAQYVGKLDSQNAKLVSRIDELEKTLTDSKAEVSKITAERDDASEKLEAELKKDSTEEISKAVAERIAVLDVASAIVKDLKVDGKSDLDLKKEVILAKSPKAKLDDADTIYVQARFDSIVENLENDSISSQREVTKIVHSDSDDVDSVAKARQDMIDRRTKKASK